MNKKRGTVAPEYRELLSRYKLLQELVDSLPELSRYKLLLELVDSLPDSIYFKDRNGKLLLSHRILAKGKGLYPDNAVGKTDFDIFPKETADRIAKEDEYVMTTGKAIIDKVEQFVLTDGGEGYVSISKIPRYDDKGSIVGLIGIMRDISGPIETIEKERIKQKALVPVESKHRARELISLLSHELFTPLSIIKEEIAVLLEGISGSISQGQRDLLVSAKENVEHLSRVVEQLLDISKIQAGALQLNYSLVNLNELIKSVADFFKMVAYDRGLRLEYNFPIEQANIFVDPERINQVITNLVNNAMKFTMRGGRIEIEIKIFEDKVRVGVIDTGIGIAKRDLSTIFNKHNQGSLPKKLKNKGMGLGLFIAKELIEKHDGEIWVESALGKGSMFYFILPRFYTTKIIDKEVREKINNLLDKGISLHLINLLIVHYETFNKLMRVESQSVVGELRLIIDAALRKTLGKKKQDIVLTDFQFGECSIILPEVTEKQAEGLTSLLRENVKRYFTKNKIESVFLNIGSLGISRKMRRLAVKEVPTKIYIKKVFLGSEKRRFRRVAYKADIEPIFQEGKIEPTQTFDISEGGLCFVTQQLLQTDANLTIKLHLPGRREHLLLQTRVAWIGKQEEAHESGAKTYKIGVEFVDLSKKDTQLISQFIELIATRGTVTN